MRACVAAVGWSPDRADIQTCARALYAMRRLKATSALPESNDLSSPWESVLRRDAPRWETAAISQLVHDALSARNPPWPSMAPQPYSDFYTLAWLR
jgi:hypothetical protein